MGDDVSDYDGQFVGGPIDGSVIKVSETTAPILAWDDGLIAEYRNTDGPFWEVTLRREPTTSERASIEAWEAANR